MSNQSNGMNWSIIQILFSEWFSLLFKPLSITITIRSTTLLCHFLPPVLICYCWGPENLGPLLVAWREGWRRTVTVNSPSWRRGNPSPLSYVFSTELLHPLPSVQRVHSGVSLVVACVLWLLPLVPGCRWSRGGWSCLLFSGQLQFR